jgi:uncharacterized protein YpbB
MMKQYHLYVFTQENCEPCERLKKHVATLPKQQQAELDFVPLKVLNKSQPYAKRKLTALAEEHNIELTPTLLVVHEELSCDIDTDGEEYCDGIEVSVERFVGANAIIEHLPATLSAYTYSIEE